ncbi:Clp protease N-terminal domain-containing protein [Amycolatopsis lurida]
MTNSSATTITPSREVAKVLTATVRRAAKLAFPAVGTENLLIALSAADGGGTVLAQSSLRAKAVARSTTHWADDDAVPDSVPDAEVTALLREANEAAHQESALPETGALRECLRAAIAGADGGVLTTTHLALALLRAPTGRAAELFTVHRVDREQAMAAVRAAAKPEDTPAVWLLRKAGALHGASGGGYVRWLTRLATRAGDLGGPVLLVVRNEAERHAVRAGRSAATAIDLVAAVLTVDEQLTNAGLQLRPEYQSDGAAALRAAGVDAAALLAADVTSSAGDVDKATAGAKLVAARHEHPVVGTTHLLMALLDNPALRGLGVDTAALRAALSSR